MKTLPKLFGYAIRRWGRRLSLEDRRTLRRQLSDIAELDLADYQILLHVDSPSEAETRLRSCKKEPMTVNWLRQELKSGDVFYDVGANVGAYSLVAAKVSQGSARILAFEPSFQNYAQLCRNIILNRCQDSIIPLPMPLCRKTQLERFHYENLEAGGALHSFSRAVDYKADDFEPVVSLGAVGFSLDEMVRIAGLPSPNLLKIDVDGLEQEILLGAGETLRHPALRSLLVEINEDLMEEAKHTIEFLCQSGLAPREKHPLTRRLHNYVFVRRASECGPVLSKDVPVVSTRQ